MPRFRRKRVKPSVITLADRARDAGKWEVAAEYYRDALRRKPENPPIWVQYGHVLKESGHLAEAEKAYRTALAYDPRNADSHLQLCHVLKIKGKKEEARTAYLRAVALDPSLTDVSLEFAQLGWSSAHLSELRSILGRDNTEALALTDMNGTPPKPSVPISSLVPTLKRERKFGLRTASRLRSRPSDEHIALIAPYFESDGLLAQLGCDRSEMFGPAEYLTDPALWPYAPHYMFNPDWYMGQLAEPLGSAINPFLHYLRVGMYEGKSPHPLFDPKYYLAQWENHEPGASIDQVFDHYLRCGRQQDISPHPLFSALWYRKSYLNEVEEDIDPLRHYLSVGYQRWFNPHILFDEGWYRRQSRDLDHHTSGLVDYIVRGAGMDFDPHPVFRSRYLKEQNLALQGARTPLEMYLTATLDKDPHPLFSASHYRSQWNGAGVTPLEHYVEEGWREGLDPHPFFRTDWYFRLFRDVAARPQNPLVHYEKVGRSEGRRPNPFFDPLFYSRHFLKDETAALPEQHYLSIGVVSDLQGRDKDPLHSGKLVRLTNTPEIALPDVLRLRKERLNPHIGVFVHAFYPDNTKDIFSYINKIPGPCMVYLSTDTPSKAAALRETARGCLRHPIEIRMLPNRGRDIAPWLVGFKDRIREVEIGVHLHTKRSPHAGSVLDGWRLFLLESLVGSPETVAAHLQILSYDNIGASVIKHFPPLLREGMLNWGHNFGLVRDLLALCNVEIDDQTPLEFPSGSMFWFKTCALEPLLKLDLQFEFFEPEKGATDGTLAHAIERAFLYIVEAAGYGWVQTTTQPKSREPAGADPMDLEAFLANGGVRLIPTERQSTALRRTLPVDVIPFNTRASRVEKPRLNLVVPTVNRSLGYAGLNNGFDLFFGILNKLGEEWDARILGTGQDPTIRAGFIPSEGFSFEELGEFDWSGLRVVSNATQRTWRLLSLRRSDIFLATAWQTAHVTSLVCEDQSRLFGIPLRKFIYLIQDYEPPFHPWSSLYYLADATYQDPSRFDAVFNTEVLARFFKERYDINGQIYNPALNPQIARHVRQVKKQKVCLIYYRTHAVRNCYELCEIIVEELVAKDPQFYIDWRFLAIGEAIQEDNPGSRIERLGRLSLEEYGQLMSRSAVGLSLMVSPHPSYPPLEMAAAGMLVLANTYEAKDLSQLHDNIVSWRSGRISDAVDQLDQLCKAFEQENEVGWKGKSRADWFFTPTDNLQEIGCALARELRGLA
jgi:hypothetical protein